MPLLADRHPLSSPNRRVHKVCFLPTRLRTNLPVIRSHVIDQPRQQGTIENGDVTDHDINKRTLSSRIHTLTGDGPKAVRVSTLIQTG